MRDGPHPSAPIGIFDSGVGGLSVQRAIRRLLPAEMLVYLADQAHVPYGSRSLGQVCEFALEITRFLLGRTQGASRRELAANWLGVKLIVVACNTASAAALTSLRQAFPEVPFVGMEPAVKPAAEQTRSGVVGVLATPATFQGELYASVVERFAQGVTLLTDTCPGLVAQIEDGKLESDEARAILEAALVPMLCRGIDTVVLGCTHYPFVIPLIQQIVGPGVRVIDPAPAVARQVARVLMAHGLVQSAAADKPAIYLTTGSAPRLQALLPALIGEAGPVQAVHWDRGRLQPQLAELPFDLDAQ